DVSPTDVARLDRNQARDLLLLAACYDQSSAETTKGRWHRLRKKLGFRVWKAQWDLALGIGVSAAILALTLYLGFRQDKWFFFTWWPWTIALASWLPRLWRTWKWFLQSRRVVKHLRVGNLVTNPLRQELMNFSSPELTGQPLPGKDRT